MRRGKLNVCSAFDRVPDEICEEIFSFYLGTADDAASALVEMGEDNVGVKRRYADPTTPLLLGKICASWREIVWSSPRLWSTVKVVLSDNLFKSQLELLGDWLARSGSCQLDISISTTDNDFWDGPHLASDVMDVIIPFSKRWNTIALFIPYQSLCDINLADDSLPCLFILQLMLIDLKKTEDDERDHVTLVAPQLSHLGLQVPSALRMALPYDQLTTFCAHYFSPKECLMVLGKAINLTCCIFRHICANPEEQLLLTPPLRLSHMTELHLKCLEESSFPSELLDSIVAPAMRVMEFGGSRTQNSPFPVAEFLNMLARSSASLQKLSISAMNIRDTDIVQCLRSIPTLVNLTISCVVTTGDSSHAISDVLIHQHLEILRLFCDGPSASTIGHILNSITTPAAYHLTLSADEYPISYAPLLGFLARSCCTLSSFTLRCTPLDDITLLQECLKLMPSVEELYLCGIAESNPSLGDSIIQMLSVGQEDGAYILPNLNDLNLLDAPPVNGVILTDMLYSRWEPHASVEGGDEKDDVARLLSVSIGTTGLYWGNDPKAVKNRLRGMCEDGMKLSVTIGDVEIDFS